MTQSPAKSRTLILINHPRRQKRGDFEEIKTRIEALTPEIDVRIVEAGRPDNDLDEHVWLRPCLIVSFGTPLGFQPKRGLIYSCRAMSKFRQVANLVRAGIPVPLSAQLEFGKALDRNHWGPFVVLKPTTPGFMSHGSAFLMRTEKVVDLAESIFPAGHPIRRAPVMVQKFVDTGEWPSYYRVLTLFGQPLYCVRGVTAEPRPPLAASDEALVKATIATNAANGSKYNTAYDTDVLELARRTYDAFPAIPLQAVDIVRDQATGGLFVLEINAGGNTWHFSSQHIASLPNTVPRVQKIAQFGAWDVAARILCKKTLERAR